MKNQVQKDGRGGSDMTKTCYPTSFFNVSEFINRGWVRTAKEKNLEETTRNVINFRNHLKSRLQEMLLKMDQEKFPDISTPLSTSSDDGFWSRFKGTDRGQRLTRIWNAASDVDLDALRLHSQIMNLNGLFNEYKNKTAHLLDVAQDARFHHIYTTSGYTWWR